MHWPCSNSVAKCRPAASSPDWLLLQPAAGAAKPARLTAAATSWLQLHHTATSACCWSCAHLPFPFPLFSAEAGAQCQQEQMRTCRAGQGSSRSASRAGTGRLLHLSKARRSLEGLSHFSPFFFFLFFFSLPFSLSPLFLSFPLSFFQVGR